MFLDTFYGNEKAKQTLVNYLTDGRLSHAVLLEGEDGCGKTAFARLIAAGLLCRGEVSQKGKPCGTCRNCRLALSDAHPDVVLAGKEDRAKGFHIEEIREIRSAAYIRPNDGDIKVYILRNAHNMTIEAQNALLKMMEEPPKNVVFLLTCNNRTRLLPTILSRAVLLPILPCSMADCVRALEEKAPVADPQKRIQAAEMADGNIGKALLFLEDENRFQIEQAARQAAETLCIGDEFELLGLFQPYTGPKKREDFLRLLNGMRGYFHKVIRAKNQERPEENGKISDRILNRVTTLQAMKILDIINKASAQVTQNVSLGLAAAAFCAEAKKLLEK